MEQKKTSLTQLNNAIKKANNPLTGKNESFLPTERMIWSAYLARIGEVNPIADMRRWRKICNDELSNAKVAVDVFCKYINAERSESLN